MIFTGKNLLQIRWALELAKAELHNQSATCPDVREYSDDLAAIEMEAEAIQKLCDRIDKKHPEMSPS